MSLRFLLTYMEEILQFSANLLSFLANSSLCICLWLANIYLNKIASV